MKASDVTKQISAAAKGSTVRQASVVLAEQGLLSVTNFLTGVLVARACTPAEYGIYVLAWSIVMIVLSLHRAVVHTPFTVLLPRLSEDERRSYQGSALVQAAVVSLLAAVALLAVVSGGWLSDSPHLTRLRAVAPVVAILVVPFVLRDFARSALFARLQFLSSVKISLFASSLQLATIFVLYSHERLSIAAALGTVVATCAMAAGAVLWIHRGQFCVRPAEIWRHFLMGWHVSRWMAVNVIGVIGASHAFPWLLVHYTDASVVGSYGAAFAFAGVMAPLLQAASAYALPRMAYGYRSKSLGNLRRMLRRATIVLAIPLGAWTVVGAVFSEELMAVLYGNKYPGLGLVAGVLLLRAFVEGMASLLIPALQTLEATRVTTEALMLGSLVTLTLGWAAVANAGLLGAAMASVVTTSVTAGWKWFRLRRICAQLSDPAE